jgi:hypothetical protein
MRIILPLVSLLIVACAASVAAGQCEPRWLDWDGQSISQYESAGGSVLWDPDGSGPQNVQWVVGGSISQVGWRAAGGVATFDTVTRRWSTLGTLQGSVFAFAVTPDNRLVAVGRFVVPGTPCRNVAIWDGTVWQGLGVGLSRANDPGAIGAVTAVTIVPDGSIVVGGNFNRTGDVELHGLARWDGTSWVDVGGGVGDLGTGVGYSVRTLVTLPGGDLLVGGRFLSAGGTSARMVARWNGATWSPMGSRDMAEVSQAIVTRSGEVYICGSFAGTYPDRGRIAKWNGAEWIGLGRGADFPVYGLSEDNLGRIVAVGEFGSIGDQGYAQGAARWDGSQWSRIGFLSNGSRVNVTPSGEYLALSHSYFLGGPLGFASSGDGVRWRRVDHRVSFDTGNVLALHGMPDGSMIAGGSFLSAGELGRLAQFDGTAWRDVGRGVNANVRAITHLADNTLIVGGDFDHAGDASAMRIASFDGNAWSQVGAGFNESVYALSVSPAGQLFAGGSFTASGSRGLFRVSRLTSNGWTTMNLGTDANVSNLGFDTTGTLHALGSFAVAGSVSAPGFAQWNGSSWSAPTLAPGSESRVMIAGTLGEVYLGGSFTQIGSVPARRIAKWQNGNWSELGDGLPYPVNALTLDAAGRLFAGSGSLIFRFDSQTSQWIEIGRADSTILALGFDTRGGLHAGGSFTNMQGPAQSVVSGSRVALFAVPVLQLLRPPTSTHSAGQRPAGLCVQYRADQTASMQWQVRQPGGNWMTVPTGVWQGVQYLGSGMSELVIVPPAGFSGTIGEYRCILSTSGLCSSVITDPVLVTACAPDINADATIDIFDYLDFAASFSSQSMLADFNRDNVLDFFDYLDFVAAFAAGCD